MPSKLLLVHAFIGLSAYLSVCVCLSLYYLFISMYYGFIPDSNKWIGLDWIGLPHRYLHLNSRL